MSRFRAIPYAKALLDVISETCPDRAEAVGEELAQIAAAFELVPELLKVMVTPMVSVEVKTTILDEVLTHLGVVEPGRRFAHVLQRHYRLHQVRQVVETYRELLDRKLGRTRARVETAARLSTTERDRLATALGELVDGSVTAEYLDKPELLAGFRVQVGSKVFDASLVAQLEQLTREISFE